MSWNYSYDGAKNKCFQNFGGKTGTGGSRRQNQCGSKEENCEDEGWIVLNEEL
jgi:hypothetical protein